ncbi:hypothetical protein CAEBREN_20118 [Caenorhabditis brenneri]|uniref:Uncharacterized protein n=1 Tax=Caenorhabditis brenneri TaxID=135651 RepID=G0MJG5_CAEBE|nr:hypothetical protein CAEBREN_20118 [Caenorhabditis brenneri]
MRLQITILLLLCTSLVAQSALTDTWSTLIDIIKPLGQSTTVLFSGEWRQEQYAKNVCPGYYKELTKVKPFGLTGLIEWHDIMTLLTGARTDAAFNFNKCDKVLEEADLVVNSFWGRLGTFVRALADLPYEA